MSSMLLEMRRVTARRGTSFQLGPVDLDVSSGEVVALVGPNGAGKSTLVMLALGALRPESGEVVLGGSLVGSLSRVMVARRATLLRQRPPMSFAQSVLEVVLHGRWAHGRGLRFPGALDLELALAALRSLGASSLAERDFRTLSGGEQQRVLIAKALSQGSPLVILDEPTTALDLRHRSELMGLIATLAAQGRGVLLVSHDLDLATSVASRMLLLHEGRILAQGPPEAVLTPEHVERAFGCPVSVVRMAGGSGLLVRPRPPSP